MPTTPVTPQTTVLDRVEITGNRIRARMEHLKIKNRSELARRCGLSLDQVHRAIRAKHLPTLPHAIALAVGLDTTIEHLFIVKLHRTRISTRALVKRHHKPAL